MNFETMNSYEEQWIACGNQWIIEETHEVQNETNELSKTSMSSVRITFIHAVNGVLASMSVQPPITR